MARRRGANVDNVEARLPNESLGRLEQLSLGQKRSHSITSGGGDIRDRNYLNVGERLPSGQMAVLGDASKAHKTHASCLPAIHSRQPVRARPRAPLPKFHSRYRRLRG